MSTTSIQAQMGYAAQASPVSAPYLAVNDRSQPSPGEFQPAAVDPRQAQVPTPQDVQKPKPQNDSPERTTRKTAVDWQTNELVYRVIDSRSGQVVSQSPDEALLRLRAYAKQAQTQSEAGQCVPHSVSRET